MKLSIAIPRLLAALAVFGLLLAPVARPAMATPADAAASDGMVAGHAAAEMPADMPCCPEKAPVKDCAQDCPLIAICLAKCFAAAGAMLAMPSALAGQIVPGGDMDFSSLGQSPPSRPPKFLA